MVAMEHTPRPRTANRPADVGTACLTHGEWNRLSNALAACL